VAAGAASTVLSATAAAQATIPTSHRCRAADNDGPRTRRDEQAATARAPRTSNTRGTCSAIASAAAGYNRATAKTNVGAPGYEMPARAPAAAAAVSVAVTAIPAIPALE
jgi:hypothetical protein